jgi:hypothetical protein
MWEENEIKEILEGNVAYKDFFDEYNGCFTLVYQVCGAYINIYNEVSGRISIYVVGQYEKIEMKSLQYFIKGCYRYLNKIKQEKNNANI